MYNSNVAFTPENRPNLYYPFYVDPKNKIGDDFYEISLEKKDGYVEVFPPISVKGDAEKACLKEIVSQYEHYRKQLTKLELNVRQ